MWPDRMLDLILNADVKPHLHQIETHPFYQQDKANVLLRRYQVAHEAWAPFAEGRENIWGNAVLTEIARNHGKSVAQVILRWLLQRDIISLSKSVHKERMQENIDIFDFELTDEEMLKIHLLDHDRPLILNNRDLEVVERISPRRM
jgi:diketogulonate reductase-like aldo/keto reductase